MIRVIQINLNHCEAADDILTQMARTTKADVVLISDPYKTRKSNNWVHDRAKLASIWICGSHAFQSTNEENVGFVRAKINGINFYSCYAPPRFTLTEFQALLDSIKADVENRSPVFLGADLNAWATEWGSRCTKPRGEKVLETFASLDIGIANIGNVPTFRKAGKSSVIDITLVSTSILRSINWRVSEEYTASDHQAIMIEVRGQRSNNDTTSTGPKWKDTLLDGDMFDQVVRNEDFTLDSADSMTNQLTMILNKACDAAMPRRTPSRRGQPCYWWNEEIKGLRRKCLQHRRRVQRSRGRDGFEELLSAFRIARQQLCKAIRESKRRHFKAICDDADINPWGTAYRMVMSKLKGDRSPQITCPTMLKRIVETLFPIRANTSFNIDRTIDVQTVPSVSNEEIISACKRIGEKKTPGPDGIPNKAFKRAVEERPEIFVRTMEKCLHEGVFPAKWKLQHLVLLPKGKGAHGEPSSLRPICLLDSPGKMFERVIYNRLLDHALENGALSNMQFGFMKNRSTVDAIKTVVDTAASAIEGTRWKGGTIEYCAVVTLDVKNAFNTANWSCIRRSLARINTPSYLMKTVESYFTDRELRYNTDEGPKHYKVSAGVPQGSVLGPLLWNIMYDGVLNIALPGRTKVIGFADDIAVVTVAKTINEMETTTNEAIRRIRLWLQEAELELADHKTEAVLITGRKKVEFMTLSVGDTEIISKQSVKYLGVMIDNRLNFKSHIAFATEKASKTQAALSRMLPNIGGPRYGRRILLSRVVSSALIYAAPIWAHVLSIQTTLRKISSVYRLSAIRTIRGYRTISTDAAYLLAGMIPIDILADEMARIYRRKTAVTGVPERSLLKSIKAEERAISLERWQSRWDSSSKGRWTYKLIPDIRTWIERKHGECSYQLTQFLSGHGGYRKYLHRFGHDTSPICPQCVGVEEDTEHAIFHCPRFMEGFGENYNPSNVLDYMLQSESNWLEVESRISSIQTELRRLEKERNNRRSATEDVA